MSQANKEQYIKEGGNKCFKCDSENIETGRFEAMPDGTATQEIQCHDCHHEWIDEYTLTGVTD